MRQVFAVTLVAIAVPPVVDGSLRGCHCVTSPNLPSQSVQPVTASAKTSGLGFVRNAFPCNGLAKKNGDRVAVQSLNHVCGTLNPPFRLARGPDPFPPHFRPCLSANGSSDARRSLVQSGKFFANLCPTPTNSSLCASLLRFNRVSATPRCVSGEFGKPRYFRCPSDAVRCYLHALKPTRLLMRIS